MTVDKITVTYEVKRSKNYQSAGIVMSITATPGPQESVNDVRAQCMALLIPGVETEADSAIREALRMDAML